jgi:glucosamine 6-phosphate synthetase-like amidotransferase/phosphosugar isomerase protein
MAKMVSAAQELENFLHGRLRMVDQINPLFLIAPSGHASQRVLDFLTVSDTIGATSIVLTDKVSPGIEQMATHIIQMPGGVDEYATPLLYILPLYLFGYELALLRGYDPTARRYDLVPQNVRYLGRN